MKKYILMLAVAAATTLVACGGNETKTEEAPVAEEAVEVVEEATEAPAEEATEEGTEEATEAPAEEAPATEEAAQ
ncbi:MAG: hypothetical protein HDS64_07620 [Bacteroidales bacterium]|nr:hypothetical protein [Bacteroidales bacterium]MBD5343236.1 hypothetical protein [Bacteroides sp.]MDE6032972.1 hypothetical protein [Muribaculaceae bacterium]MBD5353134.1 hypothetical protein [Bacteroides sp.]MBD5359133.1 hypothetical protein [Bacteroides sp.]